MVPQAIGISLRNSVALSTAEAEYVAAYLASCEEVWLRKLLFDIFDFQLDEGVDLD